MKWFWPPLWRPLEDVANWFGQRCTQSLCYFLLRCNGLIHQSRWTEMKIIKVQLMVLLNHALIFNPKYYDTHKTSSNLRHVFKLILNIHVFRIYFWTGTCRYYYTFMAWWWGRYEDLITQGKSYYMRQIILPEDNARVAYDFSSENK